MFPLKPHAEIVPWAPLLFERAPPPPRRVARELARIQVVFAVVAAIESPSPTPGLIVEERRTIGRERPSSNTPPPLVEAVLLLIVPPWIFSVAPWVLSIPPPGAGGVGRDRAVGEGEVALVVNPASVADGRTSRDRHARNRRRDVRAYLEDLTGILPVDNGHQRTSLHDDAVESAVFDSASGPCCKSIVCVVVRSKVIVFGVVASSACCTAQRSVTAAVVGRAGHREIGEELTRFENFGHEYLTVPPNPPVAVKGERK